MTIASTGWLKTVGLNDYECQTCGWNVTAGEPRVYSYAGEGRPHRVEVDYKLDAELEPIIELEEHVENVYHSFCYNIPTIPFKRNADDVYKYEDYAYLTKRISPNEFHSPIDGRRGDGYRYNIDLGESHE